MRTLVIPPLIILLSGCPGDKINTEHRDVFTYGGAICFSVDKKDILEYYRIESFQGGSYKILSYKDDLNLSYPDTCIKPESKRGYHYSLAYGLNGEHYSDSFILDNDGNH